MIETESGNKAGRPFFSWENYRLLFTVVFWILIFVTYLGNFVVAVGRDGGPSASDLLPVTLAFATTVAAWHLLPWKPDASRVRFLAVPLFVAGVFWVDRTMVVSDGALYWPLFVVVFAHGVFAFGPRGSLVYAGLILVLILAYLQLVDDASLAENALFLVVLVPSVLLVMAACAAIFEVGRRRAESEELLEELGAAHAELKDHARQVRELSVSEERTRMAREIHDSVGHYLAVVNVQLEAAGKLLADDPTAAREQIERAKTSASGALSEVRRSVRALKPLGIAERSGPGALAALARGFEGAGPEVSFETRGEERELPPEAELVLYRTLQEGLTNALKHSGARRISSILAFEPDGRVKLTVADDGRGIAEDPRDDGFGLQALGDRARRLGGTVKTGNASEGGFVLEVELPGDRG